MTENWIPAVGDKVLVKGTGQVAVIESLGADWNMPDMAILDRPIYGFYAYRLARLSLRKTAEEMQL